MKSEPIHPGEILLEEFIKPMGISQRMLAESMDVPPNRINDIVRGRRNITADSAIRLSLALGTSVEMWMRLQWQYELEKAKDRFSDSDKHSISPVKP